MSGTLTYKQLQDAVVGNTNRSDKITLIQQQLNLALDELARIHQWRDLQTETTLEQSITDLGVLALPSDFKLHYQFRVRINEADSLGYAFTVLPLWEFNR